MQNAPCHSAQRWLSYDIVRFKIEMGVEEKSKCKKRNKNTAAVALQAAQSGHQAAAMFYQRHTARAQSMLFGDDLDLYRCQPQLMSDYARYRTAKR